MTTATAPTRGPGRPPATAQDGLRRIADLAGDILTCMEKPGRNRFSSVNQLRGWLTSSGVGFTSSEVSTAISLLVADGRLTSPETGMGQPRPGWLPVAEDGPAELPEVIRVGRLCVEVARPGLPGRGARCTKEEIRSRLLDADETDVDDALLTEVIRRLVDCGQLVMTQKAQGLPIEYIAAGAWDFDEVDLLESDIVAVLRAHDDRGFDDEDQLRQWLTEVGAEFSDRALGQALGHLAILGRIQSPRPEQWEHPGPRPTWLNEPKPHIG